MVENIMFCCINGSFCPCIYRQSVQINEHTKNNNNLESFPLPNKYDILGKKEFKCFFRVPLNPNHSINSVNILRNVKNTFIYIYTH